MEPPLPLSIHLPERGSRIRMRELHRQLRGAILDGRLKPGLRLPATRVLAKACGVSRNAVVATYDLLQSEGYVVSKRGSGTCVTTALRKRSPSRTPDKEAVSDRRLAPFWRRRSRGIASPGSQPPPWVFQIGVPEFRQFPVEIWRRLSGRTLRLLRVPTAADFDAQGKLSFRQAIALHVSFSRAVACSPEDIVVTAGAQQAFELLARILVTPGKTLVAVEEPGYPPMRASFAAAGARLARVPVDNDGMSVSRIPAQAKIICVTPSHQFPLGCVMSAGRRSQLIEIAQSRGAILIEDDYGGEFRFGDRPLDALQTLDHTQAVFYVGTFSKSLHPALRLGYIVAPPWARAALVEAKALADGKCAPSVQDTATAFIEEGHLTRHVRKMQQTYSRRRETLLKVLHRDFAQWLEPIPSAAGLHVSARFKGSIDDRIAVERAREAGVGIRALSEFFAGRPTLRGIAFGYGAIEQDHIEQGLELIRRAWSSGIEK